MRKVRVEADGPNGPLAVLEVEIDISEWRRARDAPDGSLHHVRGAIEDLTKTLGKVENTLKRAAARLETPAVHVIDVGELSDEYSQQGIEPPLEREG